MGRPAGWMTELTGRSAMKSPGKPSHRREVERWFWREIAKGLSSDAAAAAGGGGPGGGRGGVGGGGLAGGWQPMVQRTWRDGHAAARPRDVPVLVLCRARGDRPAS